MSDEKAAAMAAINMLRTQVDSTGMIPVANAEALMRGLGTELQGIPAQHRRKTIARLKNCATELRGLGLPDGMVGLIDALCEGWDDFSLS